MININKTLKYISREEEERQTQILAQSHDLPYINLMDYPVLPDVLNIIPQEIAIKELAISYAKVGKEVKVATFNPTNKNLKKDLEILFQSSEFDFSLSVCSKSSYRYVLELYKLSPKTSAATEKVEITEKQEEKFKQQVKDLSELKDKIQKVSTTELLDILFAGAIASSASDIHLEPEEKDLKVRYRIDGVLQDIASLPLVAHKTLISRIKYLSKLKLDISSMPQDGRFDATVANKPIDVRVSVFPSAYGEAVAMRLLHKESKFIQLEELGFSANDIKIIREAANKPHGIIFNTGPTGSGKTTTLYAILTKLNKTGVKIITLEDPIEYRIKGVEQSQIEPEKGYTFASGLRSVLRQDPDIIMVGEVRDADTATTAIHSAMTGHLVLTTLHTNNAPSAIPRLLDMSVKPYLLGGTINLIIAQRLVRRLCDNCHGKGCEVCNKTGFKGRIAIAELFVPNKEIEDLITKKASVREFEEAAKKSGMITMMEDGMQKVAKGITTREEVLRVTRD